MAESAIAIRPLDLSAASTAEWAAFHEFRRARHAESRADDPLLPDAAVEARERQRSAYWRQAGWAAWEGVGTGQRIVGYVHVDLPDGTRPEMAPHADRLVAYGSVRRECRRRGIATRLLAEVRALAMSDGRRIVMLSTEEEDGHAVLHRLGAEETARYEDNRLRLDTVDWPLVERWYAARPADVSLTIHADRVPLAEFERMLPAINAMIADIPRDRLSPPVVESSMAMVEDWCARLAQRDGRHHMLVLTDGEGDVAAMADLVWFPDSPDRAGHNLTGVRRDRRGQGLGKAIKAAALLHIRKALPGVAVVTTGNNEVNAPMLAINRQLGFITHRSGGNYEIAVEALPRE